MRQNWFQEACTRFTMETPWFFRVVINIGLSCTGFGVSILGLLYIPGFHTTLPLSRIGSDLCMIGVSSAFLAKFVVKDPQDLPNNKPNDIPKHKDIDNVSAG